MTAQILTAGIFDQMDVRRIRFLQEASRCGRLTVVLLEDELVQKLTGAVPKFPLAERLYFIQNIRYTAEVETAASLEHLKDIGCRRRPSEWISPAFEDLSEFRTAAAGCGAGYRLIDEAALAGLPQHDYQTTPSSSRKVIVTGCYDWFHTGHIRFFEEASQYGDLYVVVGHDKNIELLKGPGHPMFGQEQRAYIVGSIRFVRQALVSTGSGWLDAEPEIRRLKPDCYIVNEDGDKPIKRRFCQSLGIEYIVLKRLPKPGLMRRTSTDLRGF
ncbi:MAG TPA: adenylyltransferase/cytidyltransferase family protein [Anaerohalosphaeraceae bacterium]|nr:adenylyltransferase/cytidyltransferase family protein [Anaerohalosphaeraceae bacterium]HPO70981.1 adenylyltransferase/cytidyltransferase family protein [Anaerohalosphaeraceae bacterium]